MSSVLPLRRRPCLAGAFGLVLGVYAFVLLVGPALHHDLACHLKSRTHCTSCVISVSAPGAPGASGLLVADLRDAGTLLRKAAGPAPLEAVRARQGRSPPA